MCSFKNWKQDSTDSKRSVVDLSPLSEEINTREARRISFEDKELISLPPIYDSPTATKQDAVQTLSLTMLSPSKYELIQSQILSSFWNSFSPINDPARYTGNVWLQKAIINATSTELLQKSLLALAITRLGSQNHDRDLVIQGRLLYGKALNLLRRALNDDNSRKDDTTLASGYVLSLYEVGYTYRLV